MILDFVPNLGSAALSRSQNWDYETLNRLVVKNFHNGMAIAFISGRAAVKHQEVPMKQLLALIILASMTQSCAFLGGAAVGALGTGAGYEINSKVQMDRLEDDYRKERISRREYEDRKRQIESGSIIY